MNLAGIDVGSSTSHQRLPIVIVGDAGFETCGCVDEGSGTAQDPYRIRGHTIENAVVGLMLVNTTAHVVVEDLSFRAVNDLEAWQTLVDESLRVMLQGFGALIPAPGFTRGFHLYNVSNAHLVDTTATGVEQGALLQQVRESHVDLTTETIPWTGDNTETQVESGIVAEDVSGLSAEGTARVSHLIQGRYFDLDPTPGLEVDRERATFRLLSGSAHLGPWDASGWIGLDVWRDARLWTHNVTVDDDRMAVAIWTNQGTVALNDSRVEVPIGNLAVRTGAEGSVTVRNSFVRAFASLGRNIAFDGVHLQGVEGCHFVIEGAIINSAVRSCWFEDRFEGLDPLAELTVQNSHLTDVRLTHAAGSRLRVVSSTLEGPGTEVRLESTATAELRGVTVRDAPGALRPVIGESSLVTLRLVDVRLERSGLDVRAQHPQATLDLQAANTTFDGDPVLVAVDGQVDPGRYGAVIVPPGDQPANIHGARIGAGGLHVWGRPSATVEEVHVQGEGAVGIAAWHTPALEVRASTLLGPLRGIAPMDGVTALAVHDTAMHRTGIATGDPPAALQVTNTTVGGAPVLVVDTPTHLTGRVGQLFARDAGTLTLEDASLAPSSISVVAHGTNVTLRHVASEGPGAGGVLAWDAPRLVAEDVRLDASRWQGAFSPADEERAISQRVHYGWNRALDTWRTGNLSIDGLEADGRVVLGATLGSPPTVRDVTCRCPELYVFGGELNLSGLYLQDGLLWTDGHLDGTWLERVVVDGGRGIDLWVPDQHELRNVLVRDTTQGLIFRGFGSTCNAQLRHGNLEDNVWQASATFCTAELEDVWWGDPDGPADRDLLEDEANLIVRDSRSEPLNEAPAITIEAETPLVAGEVSTLRAVVADDWQEAGPVTWQLPAGPAQGHTVRTVFDEPGPVTVRAQATDGYGATGTATRTLTVHDRPRLGLDWSPALVRAGEPVVLQALVEDLDGVDQVAIDVGADGTVEAHDDQLTWTFPSAGDWPVRVHAVDQVGLANETVVVVPVESAGNEAPTLSATALPDEGTAPQPVTLQLQASDLDGQLASWRVDLDGVPHANGTGAPPTLLPLGSLDAGIHHVLAVVGDDDGALASRQLSVAIDPAAPALSLDGVRLEGAAVERAVSGEAPVVALTVGDADSAAVDVELCLDGATRWCHTTRRAPGSLQVQLPRLRAGVLAITAQVTDDHGLTDRTTRSLDVLANAPPRVTVGEHRTDGAGTATFQVTAQDPEERALQTTWTTPLGAGAGTNVTVQPDARGSYPLTVQATDPSGAETVETGLLVVDDRLEPHADVQAPTTVNGPIVSLVAAQWMDDTHPETFTVTAQARWNGVVVGQATASGAGPVLTVAVSPDTLAWPPGTIELVLDVTASSPAGDPVQDLERSTIREVVRP